MEMYLHRYQQMDYWHLLYRMDEFFYTQVQGFQEKEVVGAGLRHLYTVNGEVLAMTFWWKTAYVVLTNESTGEILYSVHDPKTEWMIGCLEDFFGFAEEAPADAEELAIA